MTGMKTEQWRKQAACLGVDISVFIPDENKYDINTKLGALEYCDQCPVIWDCLRFAYDNNIQNGIYGGMSTKERRKFRFQFRVLDQEKKNNT